MTISVSIASKPIVVSSASQSGVKPSIIVSPLGSPEVEFTTLATGDVLRYSDGKWRNYQEEGLVDGGNW